MGCSSGTGTLGQAARTGKCLLGAGHGLPQPGGVVHARGVHDRGSARRRGSRAPRTSRPWPGLIAALVAGTALASPALANASATAIRVTEPASDDLASAAVEPDHDAPARAPTEAAQPDDTKPDDTEPGYTKPDRGRPDDAAQAEAVEAPRPPRIDGTYLGGTLFGGLGLVRVNDFDTNGPFAAFGGTAGVGQMVFPWLGLGLHGGGGGAVRSEQGARQTLGQGYLGVQFKLVPLAKRQLPLSLLASFGFGGGAVRQEGITKRSGYGGAQFGAAVRYELFPWAGKRRPFRGGGFGLGPELGWIGFTPAATGRPMSNMLYLAIATTFYFGS